MTAQEFTPAEAAKVARFGLDRPEDGKLCWHPDWAPYDPKLRGYEQEGPAAEVVYAMDEYPDFVTTDVPQKKTDPFTLTDIESITAYHIRSNDGLWIPGKTIGNELEMVILGKLRDGRWFTGSLWNDYTGWGCQCGATFTIGESIEAVTSRGLDERERNFLAVRVDSQGVTL